MSRALDVLLLALVALLAWKLVRADDHLVSSMERAAPITATVKVLGDEPLEGLGLLIVPADDLQLPGGLAPPSAEGADDSSPHQLAPWMGDRTTQIIVPMAGRYKVRWGIQDQGPAPRRPRGVMLELPKEAKAPEQVIEVTEASLGEPILIELPAAHAAGMRALRDE